jgi:ATP-binding cassette subfamily C (CFTR/MRP) protein 1
VHVLQHADHIVALGRNGTIAEQGSFQELRTRRGGYVQRLCGTVDHINDDSDNDKFDVPSASRARAHRRITAASPATVPARLEVPAADAPNRQMGDRKAYWYYFHATGMRNTVIFVLAELLFVRFRNLLSFCILGMPITRKSLIRRS